MSQNESKATSITICAGCSGLNRIQIGNASNAKCGHCGQPLNPEATVHSVDLPTLKHVVKNSPVPVLCDFWAPWCGPCVAFAPIYEEFSADHRSNALCVKLDTEAHGVAAEAFNIRGIPTLVVFEGGVEKARQSGALPADALKQWATSQGIGA